LPAPRPGTRNISIRPDQPAMLRDRLVVGDGGPGGGTVVFGPSEITRGLPAISRWATTDLREMVHPLWLLQPWQWPWRAMPPEVFLAAT